MFFLDSSTIVSTFPEEIKVIFHGASSPRELVYCFSLASRETVLPGLPAHISVQGNRSTSYCIRILVQENCSMKHFIIAGFYAVYNYSSILQTSLTSFYTPKCITNFRSLSATTSIFFSRLISGTSLTASITSVIDSGGIKVIP